MGNLGHLMLDLETMSDKSYAAIVSIGTVEFDIKTGEIGREFYHRIDLQSCLNIGLTVTGKTIYWWLMKNIEARTEICKGGDPILDVLNKFTSFINEIGSNVTIWGNGVRFDVGILEDAYYKCGHDTMPWDFHNEMDVRTLVALAPHIKDETQFIGICHNPIDDCKHQIKYCTEIMKKIKID